MKNKRIFHWLARYWQRQVTRHLSFSRLTNGRNTTRPPYAQRHKFSNLFSYADWSLTGHMARTGERPRPIDLRPKYPLTLLCSALPLFPFSVARLLVEFSLTFPLRRKLVISRFTRKARAILQRTDHAVSRTRISQNREYKIYECISFSPFLVARERYSSAAQREPIVEDPRSRMLM